MLRDDQIKELKAKINKKMTNNAIPFDPRSVAIVGACKEIHGWIEQMEKTQETLESNQAAGIAFVTERLRRPCGHVGVMPEHNEDL